ncbi:MAG: Hsp20/alpha crystallin family protein [Bacteroidetes bacterium]|nr:Hsp20/alpha crystallin family protein [Bacteroidota bacterium]
MDDMDDDKKFPSQRLRNMEDDMEFLFSNFFNSKFPILVSTEKRWMPPTDVIETDEEFAVIMDLANVKQEDIKLTYEAGVLTVSGVRKEMTIAQKRHYHKMEIDFGPFERKIRIKSRIVDQAIKAFYENGFLIIKLKKDTNTTKVRNIVVE